MSDAPKFEIPSFNLDATNLDIGSDEDLKSALEKEGKKGFEAGRYTFKVTKPRFHPNKDTGSILCAADPTWFNVAVTLQAADGRTKDYFVQVPTTKVKYTGKSGKDTLFVFTKFCEFMAAVGESVSMASLKTLVPKYFGSEEALKKLEGKEIDADMAREGSFVEQEGDLYKINVGKAGCLKEDGEVVMFPDFASAKIYAEGKGVKLSFVEIQKLHSKVKPVAKDAAWE